MAVDEALMRAGQELTLRLYRWADPTISLGYFQPYREFEKLQAVLRCLPVVRRLTGGGAILHDRELTYSLVIPAGHRLFNVPARQMYELVHGAFIEMLAEMGIKGKLRGQGRADHTAHRGPFFCFAREHATDVVCGGGKLIGSAQRRTRGAILQHGSIILDSRFPQQPCATLKMLAGGCLREDRALRLLIESLQSALKMDLAPGQLSAREERLAGELIEKYRSDRWTIHRRWSIGT